MVKVIQTLHQLYPKSHQRGGWQYSLISPRICTHKHVYKSIYRRLQIRTGTTCDGFTLLSLDEVCGGAKVSC